ncbi:hypothetical protein SNOG_01551 [Parastagonospora nodorum SN15]|uniref:Uncharacterized protein n=1 Tax=Phaeosphaeria nodorum (strain SN15 / ATCC MYA-4574 / FGSC 10173) TaxID=321614 RepID=Q0V363_PHANO|nr:hypothetical protein SNOG_01551 [Parastagonospora nodorum SN15]EAT91200.1 hypothetical protein SNOG_01551 [Parastagonospora nodorum SN15]
MLTSTEKFIFTDTRRLDSVLFLLLSLLIIAASLYLPDHLTIIANRLFYYFSGNEETLATGAQKAGQLLESSRALTTTQGLSAAAAAGRGVMEL